jgi:acetyl esterase/lipase
MKVLGKLSRPRPSTAKVQVDQVYVPSPAGAPPVRIRTYRPVAAAAAAPAVLWIHGGGLVMGTPEVDDENCIRLAERLGALVASVDYRLAIDAPYPAAIDDCETALRWLTGKSPRVAIAGQSAGGGLAAALAQRATDRGLPVVLQVLVYPMLDDRTTKRTDLDARGFRIWSPRNNLFGWSTYLGARCGGPDVPTDAAPARRTDLQGLPPAWIGVGTADLFHEEDLDYAQRLHEAGVPCTLRVIDGAFHAFELMAPSSAVGQNFTTDYVEALRAALWPS